MVSQEHWSIFILYIHTCGKRLLATNGEGRLMFFEDPHNHVHCIYVLSCTSCLVLYSNMLRFGLDRCVIVRYGIVCSFRGVQLLLGKVIYTYV